MKREEIIAAILDNTATEENYQELGIFKFAKIFFPDLFTSDFSILHYRMVMLLFSLLDPSRERRIERQSYFLVHREAAKSTLGSFLFPIYLIYTKGFSPLVRRYDFERNRSTAFIEQLKPVQEHFIIVGSETSSQAENFVSDIRNAIDQNVLLAQVFGEKSPQYADFDDNDRKVQAKWTSSAFVTADKTVVMGIGAGQRVRGRKVFGQRPTLIIIDDMYSRHNVKTEQTRENLNYWFFSELVNSADSIRGKILWLGTMVHPDTVVSKFRKSIDWYGIEQPIIGMEELQASLKLCQITERAVELPDKALVANYQHQLKTLSWPERHNLWYILSLYKENLEHNQLNYFYQEYMNEAIAPESVMIGEDAFVQTPIKVHRSPNQTIEFIYNHTKWKGTLTLDIGADLSSSLANNSDDTVLVVAGWARVYPFYEGIDYNSGIDSLKDGWVVPVIVHIEGGKYDVHDYEGRPGICQAIERLCKLYKIDRVVVEANGQQEIIVRSVQKYLQEQHINSRVIAEYVSVEKAERIMSILLPIAQKYKHFICSPSPLVNKLYFQILTLGISDKDDYPDALEEAYKYSQPPSLSQSQYSVVSGSTRRQDMLATLGKDAWYFL